MDSTLTDIPIESSQTDAARVSAAHLSLLLRLSDIATIFFAGLAAFFIASLLQGDSYQATIGLLLGPIMLGVALSSIIFHFCRCYWRTNYLHLFKMAAHIALGWIISLSVMAIVAYLIKSSAEYSRLWAMLWLVLGLAALLLTRAAFLFVFEKFIERQDLFEKVLIIGTIDRVTELDQVISRNRLVTGELDNVSILSIENGLSFAQTSSVLGDIKDRVANERFDKVVFSIDREGDGIIQNAIDILADTPAEILAVGDPQRLFNTAKGYRVVGGIPMALLLDRPINGWTAIAKRLEDLTIASLILAFLAPLMLLIALAVKVTSPGPVFFRQLRYGVNGEQFRVIKFRSLRHRDTDANADQLVTRGDPRVTPVGRFLRRSSLDELPQLFNVLRGDMSLVGPRPHAINAKAEGELYAKVYKAYMERHRVKPGITGWAQINGWRGETDTSNKLIRRVEFDLEYIEKWSVLFDIYILLLTPFSLIRHRDVY